MNPLPAAALGLALFASASHVRAEQPEPPAPSSLATSGASKAADPEPEPDPWLGPDKALHFAASAAFAGTGYSIGALAWDDVGPRLALGAAVGLGVGLGKEALDAAGLGDPSWKDLTWDVAGVAVGLALALAIDLGVRAATSP